MTRKLTGFNASGQNQPEIRPGDIFKDHFGSFMTIRSVTDNRIVFLREGYEHLCVLPPERLLREFTLQPQQSDLARFERAKGADEKIRVMREIIQERKGRK